MRYYRKGVFNKDLINHLRLSFSQTKLWPFEEKLHIQVEITHHLFCTMFTSNIQMCVLVMSQLYPDITTMKNRGKKDLKANGLLLVCSFIAIDGSKTKELTCVF